MRLLLHDRFVDLGTGRIEGGAVLTQFECSLLVYLREQEGRPVTRERLLQDVWGYRAPGSVRCVDTAVRRVRKKIERGEPRYLLTVQGEGYRWLDAGDTGASDPDRCLGRPQWAERLAWAEATFGRVLEPHDVEVGLTAEIRTAYEQQTAQLPDASKGILELLSLAKLGWTPVEVAHHADPAALRLLVHRQWVVVEGNRARLHGLWWPVRGPGRAARGAAAALWMERLRSDQRVDLLEILEVFAWSEVPPALAGNLLLCAEQALDTVGLRPQFMAASQAVLERTVPPDVVCRLRLARTQVCMGLGLMVEAAREADAARAMAPEHAPEVEVEAAGRQACLAWFTGDLQGAEATYRQAIDLARARPDVGAVLMTEYGGLLWSLGRVPESLASHRGALALAQEHDIDEGRLAAELGLAHVLNASGDLEEAMSRFRRIRVDARSSHPLHACAAGVWLAYAHLERLELGPVDALIEEAMQAAESAKDPPRVAMVHSVRGCAAAVRGQWEQAKTAYLRAIATLDDTQLHNRTVIPKCWVAVAAHRLGDPDLAASMLARARAVPGAKPVDRTLLALASACLGIPFSKAPERAPPSAEVRIARRTFGLQAPEPGSGTEPQT
jgi:tetratricopeptide (TPR) repeat protein